MKDSAKWATRRYAVELRRELSRTVRDIQMQAWLVYRAKAESTDFPFGWMASESAEDFRVIGDERRDGV